MKTGTNPRKFYLFMIASYAVLIFMTIQILSWVLYLNFEKTSTKEALSSSKKNLAMTEFQVESVFESTKFLSKQLFLVNDVTSLMYGIPTEQIEIDKIMYKLNSYCKISDYIDSIYIYSKNKQYFYTSDSSYSDNFVSFFDREICDIVTNKKVPGFKPFLRVLKKKYPNSEIYEEKKVYTLVLTDTFNNKTMPNGAVIINLKADWITGKLKALEEKGNSQSTLLDSDGTVTGSSEVDNLNKNISIFPFAKEIMNPWQNTGNFEKKVDGVNYLISFSYSRNLEWKIVRMVKYDLIFEQIRVMRDTTLIISFVILITALFITFLLSRNVYNPINKMIEKNVSLESMKRENYSTLRQEILKSLLSRTVNHDILAKNFKEFKIELDLKGSFLIILMRIDNYKHFCEANDSENRKLMRFAIGNIAHEIISVHAMNEVIDIGEDSVTVLLNCNEMSEAALYDQTASFINEVKSSVEKYLKISISCIVSSRIPSISDINNEFAIAREMSNYRLIYGHYSTILVPDLIKSLKTSELKYPAQKEKHLLDALMLGNSEKALLYYREMLEGIKGFPYNDLMAFLTRLALSVNTLLAQLKTTLNCNVEFDFYSFSRSLNAYETLEEINNAYESLFEEISDSLVFEKEDKLSPLVSSIVEYIEMNFQNQNLSLTEVAGHFGKSPAYLGRIFRKITARSVSDCINEVRLKKSKELLSNSNMTIEEICNSVGIINANYFYIFFKKHTGATPNEYRSLKH